MNRFRLFSLGLIIAGFLTATVSSNLHQQLGQGASVTEFTPPVHSAQAKNNNNFVGPIQPAVVEATPPSKPAVVSLPKKSAPKPKTITPITRRTSAPTATITCGGSFTAEFMCLLNQYRAGKSLGKVSYNNALAAVALKHSVWMNTTGIFSHEESDGSHLLDRCRAAGIICRGEDLARGASSPQNLLNMWVASPAHNAVLLGRYTTAGLGISGSYFTLLMN